MQLAFTKKSDRDLFASEIKAAKKFGEIVALDLKKRIADLRAATTIDDLIVSPPQKLDAGILAIILCDGSRILFSANHNSNPMLSDGEINWSQVTRIKIIRVEKA